MRFPENFQPAPKKTPEQEAAWVARVEAAVLAARKEVAPLRRAILEIGASK